MANDHLLADPSTREGNVGTFARGDNNTVRIRPEVDEEIAKIEPESAPLDTLLRLASNLGSVSNPEYDVQEEHPLKHKTTVAVAATAATTTLDLDDVGFVIPTMIGMNTRTNEHFWVQNDSVITAADGTITLVTRSFGQTAAQAMVVGDTIIFTSTALEEGQNKIDARMRTTGNHKNFTQFMEHGISLSTQQALLGVFGPNERNRLKDQGLLEYRKMRNRALLLNEPFKDTTSGDQAVYSTGGLRWIASQFNNANVGPGVSYDVIAQSMTQVIRHGGGVQGRTFWGLTNQKIWNIVSGLPEIRNNTRTTRDDDTVGFEVSHIKFPGGMLNLAIDHTLEDFDEMIVFDLNNISVAQYIAMSVRDAVQTPGSHREESQIFSQEGLKVRIPLTTARLYNMQYAA